ncbi:hypothetical protein NKDENANG_03533 [Candidatus Entotheonellaceae bacterium PAL068K]
MAFLFPIQAIQGAEAASCIGLVIGIKPMH